MSDFHDAKIVTARKPHRCKERGCVRTNRIEPGDKYVRCAGNFDGAFYSYVHCLRCNKAHGKAFSRKRSMDWAADYGIPIGDLLGFLKEMMGW